MLPISKLGWIPDLPDHRDFLFSSRPFSQVIPGISLNPASPWIPFAPVALDQGTLGSCTVNATGNAVKYARIQAHKLYAFQPSRLFDYYNARAIRGWESFDSGSYIRDAIKVANSLGTIPEELWNYEIGKFTQKPPQECYDKALSHRAICYYRLGFETLTPTAFLGELKECLNEGWPFVFGFTVYSNFPWHSTDGVVPMPGKNDSALGGHAVLAIGYDDSDPPGFVFLNSWGQGWGKHGRGKIPYSYVTNGNLSADFWTIRSVL